MNRMLDMVGTVAGVIGLLVCLISGLLRLSGMWRMYDFDVMTLFTVGIGLLVAACFLKVHSMRSEQRQ